jgi:hypothetical protein
VPSPRYGVPEPGPAIGLEDLGSAEERKQLAVSEKLVAF